MNAAMRVKRPIATRIPATHSMTPAATYNGGSGCIGNGTGKAKNLDRPCSRKSRPTTMRSTASSCGCQRESQGNSIRSSAVKSSYLADRFNRRRVSGVLLGLRRRVCMGRILGERGARAVDHVDPVVERVGDLRHQLLERTVLKLTVRAEAVVTDLA